MTLVGQWPLGAMPLPPPLNTLGPSSLPPLPSAMTTPARFDIYAPIHKALRLFMNDTLARLSRLDLDPANIR